MYFKEGIKSQDSRAKILNRNSQSLDLFGRYEKAISQERTKILLKNFNGSHLALWAMGKQLNNKSFADHRQRLANQIKGGYF